MADTTGTLCARGKRLRTALEGEPPQRALSLTINGQQRAVTVAWALDWLIHEVGIGTCDEADISPPRRDLLEEFLPIATQLEAQVIYDTPAAAVFAGAAAFATGLLGMWAWSQR